MIPLSRFLQAKSLTSLLIFQTSLCGIKWRKLVWGEVAGGFGGTPLEDPVLSSFSRCLAGDILCVWRRVAATPATAGPAAAANAAASAPGAGIFDLGIAPSPAPPPLSLTAAKELWIFWYGEEPDLSGLVSPELIACGEYIIHIYLSAFCPETLTSSRKSSLRDSSTRLHVRGNFFFFIYFILYNLLIAKHSPSSYKFSSY